MFTSSRLAPPRTCSSATSVAAAKSSASISVRKRAEPVTFVRSPIITKPVSGPISNGSSPLKAAGAAGRGPPRVSIRRDGGGDLLHVLGRRAAAAADDVDQPGLGELAEVAARVGRLLVVLAEGVGQAGVRVAGRVRRRDAREVLDERPHLRRAERAVDADDQRVGVLDRGPERLDGLPGEVPPAAVDGRERDPERQSGATSCAATIAAFAFSVSKTVSISSRSTPPSTRPRICSAYVSRICVEGVRAVGRVVDARRQRQRDVQRADRAGDEARPLGRPLRRIRPRRRAPAVRPRRSSRRRPPRARSRPGRSRSP